MFTGEIIFLPASRYFNWPAAFCPPNTKASNSVIKFLLGMMMGSSLVPLFKGRLTLASSVRSAAASIMLSSLTQAIRPSLLRFSSRFCADLKSLLLKMSAKNF
jgi:hypothetical protein